MVLPAAPPSAVVAAVAFFFARFLDFFAMKNLNEDESWRPLRSLRTRWLNSTMSRANPGVCLAGVNLFDWLSRRKTDLWQARVRDYVVRLRVCVRASECFVRERVLARA
jgi:hypothetical protein